MRPKREEKLDKELRFHIEQHVEDSGAVIAPKKRGGWRTSKSAAPTKSRKRAATRGPADGWRT
jgi:hypothetical protein